MRQNAPTSFADPLVTNRCRFVTKSWRTYKPLVYEGPMKRVPLIAAIAVFLIHLVGNPHYGFFRDELYFIICGFHPQFGYVDQPPLVPLLAAGTQIFGHSLVLLRIVPALFAAGGVYVTCELVIAFGGGVFAQAFAALVFLLTPVLLSFGMKVGTDEVGLLTWPLIALLLVRLVRGADPKLWLLIGLTIGVSFEAKYSVVFVLVALFVGLVATPERRLLANRFFALGAGIAILIALPNALWQLHYGLPILELLRNGQDGKNLIPSPVQYLVQELLITNPLLAFVWIAGAIWLLRTKSVRFLGYAYIALIVEMIVLHGKHYYPANIYPILIAAGAVPLASATTRFPIARVVLAAYAVIVGFVFVPDNLPVLSADRFVAFAAQRDRLLHTSQKATETEHGREDSLLPGDYADMHGWPELAAAAKAVYTSLPADQRSDAVVFAGNYGEASAVAFFVPDVPIISRHNQFWLWGPRGFSGKTIIEINGTCGASEKLFASRTLATTVHSRYAIRYESNVPIWICRNPREPLSRVWARIKTYD